MSLQQVGRADTACSQAPDLTLTVGLVLGAIVYGGLVTTGTNCICLLAPSSGKSGLRTQLFRWYVYMLLVVNTIFGVETFLWTNFCSVFGQRVANPVQGGQLLATLEMLRTLSIAVTATLTDTLLVWRCYSVQTSLVFARSKVLTRVFWLIPQCLWMTTLVLGVAGGVIMKMVPPGQGPLADLAGPFLITAMSSHAALNLFATVFIISNLILYQRVIKNSFGTPTEGYTNRVVEMILESSAMSLPLTTTTIVGVASRRAYGIILLSIVVPGQSFASVLVMYRIALGKAISPKLDEREVLGIV